MHSFGHDCAYTLKYNYCMQRIETLARSGEDIYSWLGLFYNLESPTLAVQRIIVD